jgi:ATP synthase F1 delta subunit
MINFILVLVDKGRAGHFPRIVRQYELLLHESQGFSHGIIYSAVNLSKEQLSSFENKVGEMIDKKVRLDNRNDKSLIGGVRIFVEGRLIDASVKKRLDHLKESLIEGIQ